MDRKDVEKVAHLARIHLDPEEVEQMTTELDEILTGFRKLSELDTDGVEPMIYAVEMKNSFRQVSGHRALTPEEALQNAPIRDGAFFSVPKTFQDRGGEGSGKDGK